MRWLRIPLCVALAGALGFAAHRLATAPAETVRARRSVVARDAIDPEKLSEVIIDRDGTRYRFVRRGASWWQTAPVEHAADGWAVRQFATRVMKAESVRTVELATGASEALAAAGLSPPEGRVELVESSGEPARPDTAPHRVVVELGKRSLAGRAYARVVEPAPSTPRYEVIDASLHDFALEHDPKEFRRRDIFVDIGEVDRIELTASGTTTAIQRTGRAFRIDGPIKTRADRQQCEELVDAIRRARSGGFVVDNPAELSVYGLQPPAAVLAVQGGGASTRLLIGDPVSIGAQDRFGLVEGTKTVVRLPAAVLAGVAPRADRLIDTLATGVRAQDVGAIEITQGEASMSLRRETDGWSARVVEPAAVEPATVERRGTADPSAVAKLLAALTETRAGSVQIAAFPTERARATITLRGFAGEALDTVRVASGAQGGIVFENGDGVLRVHGAIELPLSRSELGFTASRAGP
jgi:hypothetical protein